MKLLTEARKLLVYVAGIAAGLIALGVLHGTALAVTESVLAVLTGAGIHQVPNKPPSSPPTA